MMRFVNIVMFAAAEASEKLAPAGVPAVAAEKISRKRTAAYLSADASETKDARDEYSNDIAEVLGIPADTLREISLKGPVRQQRWARPTR